MSKHSLSSGVTSKEDWILGSTIRAIKLLNSRLDKADISTPNLGELLQSVSSGATPKRSDSSLYAQSGIRFLRILNVDDGEILDTDLKYITDEVHQGQLQRSQLADDDVLMTITGRVGSAAVVRDEHLPANINQHLVRMRIDTELCRPEFLSEWLNSPAGLSCPTDTYPAERELLWTMTPSVKFAFLCQSRFRLRTPFCRLWTRQGAERNAKLTYAESLTVGFDGFVMDTLGIAIPPQPRGTLQFGIATSETQ